MSLLSQLFGGDQRLLAAATGDAGHILPGASGPHVGKIQEALNRLDGAKLAVDSQYGPKTVAAVAAFKTKRNILNTAGKIDNIVGKKTMAALDSEMLAKEQGGGGGGLLLNFKVGELAIPTPALPPLHLLFYFSGVADEFQLGGVLLVGAHGQDVLTDMENLPTPAGSLKRAIGFGGTLIPNNRLGVDSAFTIINTLHNPPSKLIIYGFSAGGVNAQDLCRKMSKELPSVKVDLLVTEPGRLRDE